MQIKLTFLGAVGNVTGSCYLVEANGVRVLIDCGLYQERKLKDRNWEPFPVPLETIQLILLSHAHLDHCGLLPKLVKDGFDSPVYCTEATAEIAKITLLDSAHIQMEDAEFKKRRHQKEGKKGPHPELPLYTTGDAEASFPLFSPVKYGEPLRLNSGLEASFHEAGHVLGSSMIKLKVRQKREERTIIFSGDVGGWGKPIVRDSALFAKADYVLIESTYGDKLLEDPDDVADKLADTINETVKAGGNIVIPAFAVERAQEVLYYLNKLLMEDRIPHLFVFVDSPMAVSVTEVFDNHPELFDQEMSEFVRRNKSPFNFPGLTLVRTIEQSKAINHIKGNVIIIAGSGMCTGGRIKHHLVANISRPESTIFFVGYQAEGTLGRLIADGAKEVRILGQTYPVNARIVQVNGFSAHADRDQLLKWLSGFQKPPRHLFITHGEPAASQSFSDLVKEKLGWKVSLPGYRDEVLLD